MSESLPAQPSSRPRPVPEAERLGRTLADLIDDPEAFVRALESWADRSGFGRLRSSEGRRGRGPVDALPPEPLLRAVIAPVEAALAEAPSTSALWLGARLERSALGAARRLVLTCLARALPDDPEQAWQGLRRLARAAQGRREVDALAAPWARGIAAERFRWAEIEQLIYSERPTERRLVASVLACLAHEHAPTHEGGRAPAIDVVPVLGLVGSLMGDADTGVQAALVRVLRAWAAVAPAPIGSFLAEQSSMAVEQRDGHRAWVIRRASRSLPGDEAIALRDRLTGIRRVSGTPATSTAARQAAAFGPLLARADAAAGVQGERFAGARR